MDSLILKTHLAGFMLALLAGPIGCLICWRRLAYFSDMLAHSSLLGVTGALALNAPIYPILISFYLLLASLLEFISRQAKFGTDAVLIFFASTFLALGYILNAWLGLKAFNLMNFLWGDILAISNQTLWGLFVLGIILGVTLRFHWSKIVSISVNSDLAFTEGLAVSKHQWLNTFLITLFIALAIRLVGLLLLTALLIIPALTARLFSRSPMQMAILSSFFGILGVAIGIQISFYWDIPTGPCLVFCNSIIFAASMLWKYLIIKV